MSARDRWDTLRQSVATMQATSRASNADSQAFVLSLVLDEMRTIEIAHPDLPAQWSAAQMYGAYIRWYQDRIATLPDSEIERRDLIAEAFAAGWTARTGGTP